MAERRPLYGLLIGLMLFSCWQIPFQQEHLVPYLSHISVNDTTNDPTNPTTILLDLLPVNDAQQLIDNDTTNPTTISLDLLPVNDAQQLIDLHNFEYIIPQPACSPTNVPNRTSIDQPTPHMLILIHSAPLNVNKRNVIRETWGRNDPRARLFFLLGAVTSRHLQLKLEKENDSFGDLIQGNFIDAYRNLTYKHVMGLKWLTYNCPETKYLLKTDDDVFVNTPNLYEFLQDPTTLRKEFIFCFLINNAVVYRRNSKWKVSLEEYKDNTYPPYCNGPSIVYSVDTAFVLYRKAQLTPFFWIDDVHVTGTLAAAANVTIHPLGARFLDPGELDDFLAGGTKPAYEHFLFAKPGLTEAKIRAIWRQVMTVRYRMNSTTLSSML